jgi:DnaJ-class molecular chaperone
MICPSCHGQPIQSMALACGRGVSRASMSECRTCAGTGEVTTEHASRIADGECRRQGRIERGLSLAEEAKRLGMMPQELSDIEFGRAK